MDNGGADSWVHAPEHRLGGKGAMMVTAGTYGKKHIFRSDERLKALSSGLLKYAERYGWRLQAWAIFPNHYHWIGMPPEEGSGNLKDLIREFHSRSARWVNRQDGVTGRKVWHNYWESALTYEASYYARLNYVHQNAVKHGVVLVANQYRWCSAGWFEKRASQAQVKTVYGFKIDQINVKDDFDV